MILKYIFSVKLGWLPSIGQISVTIETQHPTNFYLLDAIIEWRWDAFWDVIKHLILPAIALGSIPLAIIMRITRAAVLDVQNEDYVRTARAKGLSPRIVDRTARAAERAAPDLDDHRPPGRAAPLGRRADRDRLRRTRASATGSRRPSSTATSRSSRAGSFPRLVFVIVNLVVDVSYAFFNPRIRYSR